MIILRGKFKGLEATLHQASNDWLSIDVPLSTGERVPRILNPEHGEYDAEEIRWLEEHAAGSFWRDYEHYTKDDVHRLRKVKRHAQ